MAPMRRCAPSRRWRGFACPIARVSRPSTRLYPVAESPGVQTAIAAVLIRADYRQIAKPELVQTLREHRLKSAGAGQDLIDVLIRRLQAQ